MAKRETVKRKELDKKFDALYKEMQTPEAQKAFEAILNATPEQLTKAARKSVKLRNAKK